MNQPPTTEKMAYVALLDVDEVARRTGQREAITTALSEAINRFQKRMTDVGRPSEGLQFALSTRLTPAIGSNSWLNAVWLHLPEQMKRGDAKNMLFVPNANPKEEPWLISQGRLPAGTPHATRRYEETLIHGPDILGAVALLATRQVRKVWMLEQDAGAEIPDWMISSTLWAGLGIQAEKTEKNFMGIKRSFVGIF